MKKTIIGLFIFLSTSISSAQLTADEVASLQDTAKKIVTVFQKTVNSEERKKCESEGVVTRYFTNSCNEFFELLSNKSTSKALKISTSAVDYSRSEEYQSISSLSLHLMVYDTEIATLISSYSEGDVKKALVPAINKLNEEIQTLKKSFRLK
jgi:hypothetical protein